VEPAAWADGGAGEEASSDKTSSGDSYTGSGPAGSLCSMLQQLAECRPEDVIRQQELLVQLAAAVQQQEPSSIQSIYSTDISSSGTL
jgi:hypothetical protein